jgi:aspartate kinase
MSIIVQKYGGTSVADAEKIRNVAGRIIATKKAGHQVAVVVSALGGMTDDLVRMAYELNPNPAEREMDMLLATGEQVSIALLSMAIAAQGHDAISFTGGQVGIVTDGSHTKAKIVNVRASRLLKALDEGKIAIVAGFQGVTDDHDITTLGRGGSDTSAVAVAAKLGAERCEIYTDVAGVYTADPRLVPDARKLAVVSYDEMLEMAATGAKVLQLRSVEYGRNYGVKIAVKSSFDNSEGTLIEEGTHMMEKAIVSAVTHDTDEAKITIFGVPDRPGIAATVFRALADRQINVDMIIQNVSDEGITDISFTLPGSDLVNGRKVVDDLVRTLEARGCSCDEKIAKLSLVGAGMKSHPGIAARMFEILAEENINIDMISTSSIKLSCVIAEDEVGRAVRALHAGFNLAEVPDKEIGEDVARI